MTHTLAMMTDRRHDRFARRLVNFAVMKCAVEGVRAAADWLYQTRSIPIEVAARVLPKVAPVQFADRNLRDAASTTMPTNAP